MTGNRKENRRLRNARGFRITETWHQRAHREQLRDMWTLVVVLALAALAIAVLK